MRFGIFVLGALSAAAIVATAVAEEPTVEKRLDVMKVTINGAVRPPALMADGKQDFDPALAKQSMETIAAAIAKFVTLFPPGSDNIQDKAAPTVWSDSEGFKAAGAKLEADAKAAAAAADQGLDAFKAAFDKVGSDCGACHQKYRIKEE